MTAPRPRAESDGTPSPSDGARSPGDGAPTADDRVRVAELVEEIRRHNELYYTADAPEISDAEFDALLRELRDLENRFPELRRDDSPTQVVGGAPIAGLESVEHRRPMLSLENTYHRDEVIEWLASVAEFLSTEPDALTLVAEPKFDGVAIEVIYEEGRFTRAVTRGDGRVGDDVTHTVRTIRSLPTSLAAAAPPALLEVRGEVFMRIHDFAALNHRRIEAGLEPFINPRNTTSGALKLLDAALAARRPMDLYCYGLGETDGFAPATHHETLEALSAFGLPTAIDLVVRGSLDDVLAHYDDLLERRDELPFEIDGVVIKVDDRALQRRLGERSRTPRWAIAFKLPARQGSSLVRDIHVQVGRTGALTPVAVVAPVHVSGVTIEHVTLHNRDEIARLGVKVGDRVLIERAGDVIPKIVGVSRSGDGAAFEMPAECPACGTAVVDDADEVVVRCPNRRCPAVLRRRIEHFVSRAAMDVDGMGGKLIDQLVSRGLVTRLSDLYALDRDTLAGLERMGEQSAANVVAGLEASRTRPLARLLFGLGIRHVGETVAQRLAEHWGSLEALREADVEALTSVNEIGPKVAESVVGFFADEDEQADLERMRELGVAPGAPAPRRSDEGPLAGRSFLFTGKLERMTRREGNERVKAAGGRLLSSVSKNLDVLVVGEKPGSKLKKAEELGVQVMTEDEFLALLGEGD